MYSMWNDSYIASFNTHNKYYKDLMKYIEDRLINEKLKVFPLDKEGCFSISATPNLYYKEAEHQQLMKLRLDSGILDEFTVEEKTEFKNWDSEDFFSSSERCSMLAEILDNISPDNELILLLEKMLNTKVKYQDHESIFHLCDRLDVIEELQLSHDRKQRQLLWKKMAYSFYSLPVNYIRDYYGEQVSFYFAWMNFYTAWLMLPGIISFIAVFITVEGTTIDNSAYAPFYAIGMVIWGFFFIKLWKRKSSEYSFEWDTYDRIKKTIYRPEFYGDWQRSKVTDEMELHYPSWKRRLKYLVSIFVTSIMLCIAFIVMLCSLNLQGYVSCHTRYGTDNPFHISFLHQFSEPGAIFDPYGPHTILKLIPVILHAIVIMILNQQIYSRIAERLTDWENHKTDEDYENALILKRFLFEAFDCYISLFYLAFFEFDIVRLRSELVALYTSDCIRRVITETILPYIIRKTKIKAAKKKQTDKTLEEKKLESDSSKQELELFDDYLEMVIQYGYITLFASAFPLSAAVSFLTNMIEMKSDAFKLSFVVKRPNIRRVKSIGTWYYVLVFQTWLAVITNVFLFAFTSEQMLQWFPSLFEHFTTTVNGVEVIEQSLVEGSGRYVLGLVFSLEHILFVIGLGITFFIDDIPIWVRNALERREYYKTKEIKKLRQVSRQLIIDDTNEKKEQ